MCRPGRWLHLQGFVQDRRLFLPSSVLHLRKIPLTCYPATRTEERHPLYRSEAAVWRNQRAAEKVVWSRCCLTHTQHIFHWVRSADSISLVLRLPVKAKCHV